MLETFFGCKVNKLCQWSTKLINLGWKVHAVIWPCIFSILCSTVRPCCQVWRLGPLDLTH